MRNIILVLLGIFLQGCFYPGGGGGVYFPPEIAVNSINLSKIEQEPDPEPTEVDGDRPSVILKDAIDQYHIVLFRERIPENRFRSGLKKYRYPREFQFGDEHYVIACGSDDSVGIFDDDMRLIRRLEVPRYARNAYAFEIILEDKRQLVICVSQQTTSNSSTLFVLDHEFNIVYQEHLLRAQWIAAPIDPSIGQFFLCARKRWKPEDEWLNVGGPWLYTFETEESGVNRIP